MFVIVSIRGHHDDNTPVLRHFLNTELISGINFETQTVTYTQNHKFRLTYASFDLLVSTANITDFSDSLNDPFYQPENGGANDHV